MPATKGAAAEGSHLCRAAASAHALPNTKGETQGAGGKEQEMLACYQAYALTPVP